MIHISRGYDLNDRRDAAMFEDRRRLFVDTMRWDVPVHDDRYEIDQFDGPAAVYLCEVGQGVGHNGSMRLLPSSEPHILGNLFPELCSAAVPRGPGIWEITRLCLPTRLGAKQRLVVRNRLISAMVDHALATDIRILTGVVRPDFRDMILAMGWEARTLGPPMTITDMTLGAFAITLDVDTPARLGATGIYSPSAAPATVAA